MDDKITVDKVFKLLKLSLVGYSMYLYSTRVSSVVEEQFYKNTK